MISAVAGGYQQLAVRGVNLPRTRTGRSTASASPTL